VRLTCLLLLLLLSLSLSPSCPVLQPHGRAWDRWLMMGSIGMTTGLVGYCLYLVSRERGGGGSHVRAVCSSSVSLSKLEIAADPALHVSVHNLLMPVCVRACCLLCGVS